MRVCGNPDSGLLVIQAMDARELERLEDEVRALQDMGGALPLWAAFAVEDWNDALSPWPAPPVFGRHGFGGHAEETKDAVPPGSYLMKIMSQHRCQ